MIEVRGLTKSFGKVKVLQGLDLQVEPGQVYGFLGRNGAGKSTTIKILVGILTIGKGEVRLFGESMTGNNTSLRQRIGYVAQEQNFYAWMTPKTLGEFVRGFYPNWDDARYQDLIDFLELPFKRKVGTFSGGMMAKQALALALAHNPPLLILDEPTAGLDPVARREFFRMVRTKAQDRGTTILFSSHLIDEVERSADQVGIIEQGQMLYEGSLRGLSSQLKRVLGCSDESVLPVEFEIVQDFDSQKIVRCSDPADFEKLPQELTLEDLSLEDIFIELITAKKRVPS